MENISESFNKSRENIIVSLWFSIGRNIKNRRWVNYWWGAYDEIRQPIKNNIKSK